MLYEVITDLLTESGRALTAHHAVLITNVIDTEQVLVDTEHDRGPPVEPVAALQDCLQRCLHDCDAGNAIESYREATGILPDLRVRFLRGQLNLRITSYNVCYTKLLRKTMKSLPQSLPGQPMATE